MAFPREWTTAFQFPHSDMAESNCGNHNPSTTPTLFQPMTACATVVYVAYTMHARADMDAVQCLLTLASGYALRSVHMQCKWSLIPHIRCGAFPAPNKVQMQIPLEAHAQQYCGIPDSNFRNSIPNDLQPDMCVATKQAKRTMGLVRALSQGC